MYRPLAIVALAAGGATAAASQGEEPEDVIITARKLAEPLARVPLAVQVLAGRALEDSGVDGLQALAAAVPGLYFESGWGGEGSAPTLRGQAQPSQSGDNVGVFVDGVYQANTYGVDASLLDIERIEVVKGPQSAIYGHSTFAGAINYVSRRPTSVPEASAKVALGDAGMRAATIALSGPLADDGWRARVAIQGQESEGTARNLAQRSDHPGGYRKWAVASTLESPGDAAWGTRLQARLSRNASAQPAVHALSAPGFNCGARDPASGYWSYFCGDVPATRDTTLSGGLPASTTDTLQVSLAVSRSGEHWQASAFTTWYRSASDAWRDFDASAAGELLGLCSPAAGCTPARGTPLGAFALVNELSRDRNASRELAQELRWSWQAGAASAMLGVELAWRRDAEQSGFAAGPLALNPGDRLTAILPATPLLAGPASIINRFLVADPTGAQVLRSADEIEHRTRAAFGSIEYGLAPRLRLHAELRVTHERGQDRCLLPGCGPDPIAAQFTSLTPRVSLDLATGTSGLAWLSAARGVRSGGSNDDSTLLPAEQSYRPESNWTYEFGLRGPVLQEHAMLDAAVYYIDWRDTQILGPALSPGDHGFILRNLSGIYTTGLELASHWPIGRTVRVDAQLALQRARFRAGSEDVGGIGACGVSAQSTASSFCVLGPSRNATSATSLLVPWIDGRPVGRAPPRQWLLALAYEAPARMAGWQARARVAFEHQDAVYARSIGGARYGERDLLEARLSWERGPWRIEAWGSNLGNQRYVRMVASRGPAFFPTSPRPLDLIAGDGRRVGLALQWQH